MNLISKYAKHSMEYPNIIFLCIDSLRNDKFYHKEKTSFTPNIDSLIKNGTYFSQAISSADGTILGINTILNGQYPNSTGIRSKKIMLNENNLVQFFKEKNYHFYGFLPNLTSFKNMIELCENTNCTYEPGPPTIPLLKTGNKIIDFLNSEKMLEPWIYFLHIFDLHVIREGSVASGLENYNSDKFGNTKYERIVSSIDVWVGKIIKKIDFNKTLIVLTADHGERIPIDDRDIVSFEPEFKKSVKFGKKILPKSSQKIGGKFLSKVRKSVASVKIAKANQNLTSYQIRSRLPHFTLSLYDENIRIPLLFCGYNIKSKIINQQVSAADIFLTLTDILQNPLETKLDGTSLFPLLSGRKIPENPIYLHTMPHEDLTDDDAVGVRTSQFKYFRHARNSGKNIHLFDLKNDPLENENIFYDFPDVVKKMEEIISNYPDNPKKSTSTKFSEEEQKIAKELKKLGYM